MKTSRKSNPKIVYCSISGFGPKGPYRDMPGYDTIGQARSGLLSLLTDPGKPQGMGISFSDHLTGMYACYGVLGALMNRMLTGEGQHVETSLLRASVSFVAENAARYFETGHVPRRKHRTTTAGVFAFEDRKTVCHSCCTCRRRINFGLACSTSSASRSGLKIRASTTAKRAPKTMMLWSSSWRRYFALAKRRGLVAPSDRERRARGADQHARRSVRRSASENLWFSDRGGAPENGQDET